MPFILTLLLLTVPTYIWLNETNIPDEFAHEYGHISNAVNHHDQPVYREKLNFYWHMYIVTLTIGNLFMSLFAGIGMIMLPYDLINEYIYRPKYIDKNAWTKRQRVLLPMLMKLREEGKRLEKEAIQVELMRGLTGYTRRYAFSKAMTVWQTRTLMAEKEFEKLQD